MIDMMPAKNTGLEPAASSERWNLPRSFTTSAAALSGLLLVLLACFTDYSSEHATDEHVRQYYMFYIHVAIMVFIGLGYLMSFLRRYGYSAVALNFFASALVMLEYIVVGGAVHQKIFSHGHSSGRIELDMPLIIDATFAAATAMISMCAVIGRTTPTQLLWLAALQVPVYAFDMHLVTKTLHGLDIGGGMSLHVFAAYYGLAASLALKQRAAIGHKKCSPTYNADMMAMLGTIALWIFWPSFTGALASQAGLDGATNPRQFYCIMNTLLSMLGSAVATFAVSALVEGKFDMVHIQNATLAGGVAAACPANLRMAPAFAAGLGMVAGSASTLGFKYLTPLLERTIGLHDTCGINSVHGIPGIISAIAAAIAAAGFKSGNAELLTSSQSGWQIAALLACIAVACASGYVAGLIVKHVNLTRSPQMRGSEMFDDSVFWARVEPEEAEQADSDDGDVVVKGCQA